MKPARLIVWIRKELRVQDHLALWAATQDAHAVLPVYIFDRTFPASAPAQQLIILRSVRLLRDQMESLGGGLIVRTGDPADVLVRLCRETDAAGVYLTRRYEPGTVRADETLRATLASEGKTFRQFKDDVIFEKGEIVNTSGEPYRVYSAYRRAWLGRSEDIPPPLPTLVELNTPSVDRGEIPQAHEVGLSSSIAVPGGGESAGLAALDEFLDNRAADYRKGRDIPGITGTSRLSHHLAVGTLSVRRVYREISKRLGEGGHEARGSEGLNAFLNQIIWREFYKQILANFPHVDGGSFRKELDAVPWKANDVHYDLWRDGLTGYPIVDAAMRQLKTEGWMHNRGRMITASFLTKDLHVDWRLGERHFMEHLADWDLALNNGGWQWSAGTGTDAQPWYRIFNPVLQGKKFDPDGAYVKKYLPELSNVPDRYIHSPWLMPAAVQSKAGIRIGADYPKPVVDHNEERNKALARYRTSGNASRPRGTGGDYSNNNKPSTTITKKGNTTMKQSIMMTLLMLFAAAPSLFAGEPKSGTVGLGWYSPSAPVGGRVWLSPQIGLDLGLGFANDKALGTTESRVHVNVGFPVNVVTTERVNFFIRPGVEFQTNSRLDASGASAGTTFITADLGAEWFVTDQFSLSAGHGVMISQVSGSDDWGITALRALSFDNVGFHFYFNN